MSHDAAIGEQAASREDLRIALSRMERVHEGLLVERLGHVALDPAALLAVLGRQRAEADKQRVAARGNESRGHHWVDKAGDRIRCRRLAIVAIIDESFRVA